MSLSIQPKITDLKQILARMMSLKMSTDRERPFRILEEHESMDNRKVFGWAKDVFWMVNKRFFLDGQ